MPVISRRLRELKRRMTWASDDSLVLDAVGLVDDDVLPGELLEVGLLPEDHLVAGDADVEVLVDEGAR